MQPVKQDILCQMVIQDIEGVVDATREEDGALRIYYIRQDGKERVMLCVPPIPDDLDGRYSWLEQVRRTITADNRLAAHT
ncbi:MAG: hypothetical protein COB03_01990 [Alteromonas sp.]|nr:hypothetical protein [Halomonas sp.]PHS59635.1 MAG: hypothetical protein COB03_01990 [Alteromonas sp.]